IAYKSFDGYQEITSEDCIDKDCRNTQLVAALTKSPGEPLETKAFISAILGKYNVLLAGGTIPPEPETARVRLEETLGTIEVPYCIPDQGCDEGVHEFPFSETSLFERKFSDNRRIIVLTNVIEGIRYYFSWEENGPSIVFRNYQYPYPDRKIVCLEHVLQKKP
ncbi:MAG: hypothetical protein HY537_17090, partial [Deltaproteobacteria bacterium]|nr:hypothetical protein [Deltaproteobacteria bacterium]